MSIISGAPKVKSKLTIQNPGEEEKEEDIENTNVEARRSSSHKVIGTKSSKKSAHQI